MNAADMLDKSVPTGAVETIAALQTENAELREQLNHERQHRVMLTNRLTAVRRYLSTVDPLAGVRDDVVALIEGIHATDRPTPSPKGPPS